MFNNTNKQKEEAMTALLATMKAKLPPNYG